MILQPKQDLKLFRRVLNLKILKLKKSQTLLSLGILKAIIPAHKF